MKTPAANKAIEGIHENWRSFESLSPKLKSSKEFLLQALKADSRVYRLLPEKQRSDQELSVAALSSLFAHKKDYDPTPFIPKELFDDVTFIKTIIGRKLGHFQLASKRIRTTPSIVCELIAVNEHVFPMLDEKLRDDPQVVLAAVEKNCGHFHDASERLRNDEAFVTACLEPGGIRSNLLSCAAHRFRDDPVLIEKAIKRFGGYAIWSASHRLLMNRELVKKAFLAGIGQHRNYFPEWVKKDRELCLIAIKNSYLAFSDTDYELQNDLDFCLEAYQVNSDCLPYIPSRIRKRSAFRKIAPIEQEGPTPAEIRQAFAKALEICGGNHQLSGRGHDPRVTLNKSTAAAIKGLDLPRVSNSGFGAKWYYPQSLVDEAAKLLGVGPTYLRGL